MHEERNLTFAGIILAILAVVIFVAVKTSTPAPVQQSARNLAVGNAELNRSTIAPTNTYASCDTTSTLAVATSTSRTYLAIVNNSANTVYLGIGRPAVGSNGIRLNANGGSFEMDTGVLFTTAVNCIASSTSMLTVVEAK